MNFQAAADYWSYLEEELVLNPPLEVVQELHRCLFGAEPAMQPGELKSSTNFVKLTGGQYQWFTLPQDVPGEFARLRDQLQMLSAQFIPGLAGQAGEGAVLHAIFLAFAHARMIYIHPFADGNGRVARWISHAQAQLLHRVTSPLAKLLADSQQGKQGKDNRKYLVGLQQAPVNLFFLATLCQLPEEPALPFPLDPPYQIPAPRRSRPPTPHEGQL
jgi:hypothetical protein